MTRFRQEQYSFLLAIACQTAERRARNSAGPALVFTQVIVAFDLDDEIFSSIFLHPDFPVLSDSVEAARWASAAPIMASKAVDTFKPCQGSALTSANFEW